MSEQITLSKEESNFQSQFSMSKIILDIDRTIFKSFQNLNYVFFQSPLLIVMVQGAQQKPMLVAILQTIYKVADCLKGIVIGAVHVLLLRFHLNFIKILSKGDPY